MPNSCVGQKIVATASALRGFFLIFMVFSMQVHLSVLENNVCCVLFSGVFYLCQLDTVGWLHCPLLLHLH